MYFLKSKVFSFVPFALLQLVFSNLMSKFENVLDHIVL